MKPLKEKKPFQAPHTFVILVALILLAVAATYVVPAGEYTRYTDEATNRTLVEAGSFHYVESHPVSFLTVPALIYRAIVKGGKHSYVYPYYRRLFLRSSHPQGSSQFSVRRWRKPSAAASIL